MKLFGNIEDNLTMKKHENFEKSTFFFLPYNSSKRIELLMSL